DPRARDDGDHRERLRMRQAERDLAEFGELGLAVRRVTALRTAPGELDRARMDAEPRAEDRPDRAVRDDVAMAEHVGAARCGRSDLVVVEPGPQRVDHG